LTSFGGATLSSKLTTGVGCGAGAVDVARGRAVVAELGPEVDERGVECVGGLLARVAPLHAARTTIPATTTLDPPVPTPAR